MPRDFVIDLQVAVSPTAPHIVLSWTQRIQANITAQKIHRRLKGETTWVKLADLTTTDTSYADNTAVTGVEYEYWMERTITGFSPTTAMGYISAGVDLPMIESRGTLLLVVDDTMVAPLAPEIAQLQRDLIGDGWAVVQIVAARADTTPVNTKTLIQNAYNADPANVKAVYLLGHVPVPYSGSIAPDGHGNHRGAWPADGFYGDMDGTWTDTSVNNTSASGTRNDNVPGDGKYDQSTLPSMLELQVGRVDLHSMTRAPSSAASETELLRRYLRKAHDFRYKQGAYANIARRGLIRDGFRYFNGENFAMSAWAWEYTGAAVPPATTVIDEAPSWEWFTPSYASGNTYLIGEANGGGSHEYASALGNSSELGSKASKVVFTSFFGSYHGDWDANNNLMRASLAGNATGDSLGLCCFWAGRPHYFMHHMGMGETLGYSIRTSQNSGLTGGGGYTPGGSSYRGVHTGVVGDPALRLHVVEPPRGFGANSANGEVTLRWDPSSESSLTGYHVYRGDLPTGPFVRLTASPLAATTYTDATVTATSSYTYLVRTLITETAAGGTYGNQSHSAGATITASSAATAAPFGPSELSLVAQTSSVNTQIAWSDNSSDETGFRIERRTNAGGAWSTLAAVAADVTGYTDAGPFTQGDVYYYRVVATGAAGDSLASDELSVEAVAGFFNLTGTLMKVDKSAGNAVVAVERFGGGVGAVDVNYATTNSSAVAGTHFTASSGTVSWMDGEQGIKNILVPLTNTATPQLPRQFRLTLSSPTGGTGIGVSSRISVLIEDASAIPSAPWSQTLLGNTSIATTADHSPGVEAEGKFGDAMVGGTGVSGSARAEAGSFIYQSRSGDGTMTMFVPTPTPSQSNARFAVMVRESTANNSTMAAAVTSGNATGFGAKLSYRAATNDRSSLIPAAHNDFRTPRWVRLSRAGTTFTAEASVDGVAWDLLGSAPATIPDNALWGMFHYSQNWARSTTYLGDYQLATFENVSFGALPLPTAATDVAAAHVANASPYVRLTWTNPLYGPDLKIERRVEGGAFVEIAAPAAAATGSYDDSTIDPDTAYEYRIRAINSSGTGPWSATAPVATPPADTVSVVTASADAMVRYDNPTGTYGTTDSVTIAAAEIVTGDLSPVTKGWFRFDMNGALAAKSLALKLTVVSEDLQPSLDSQGFYYSPLSLLPDASDTWDESTIHWNNAPQNDTTGLALLPVTYSVGAYFFSNGAVIPGPGEVVSFPLTLSTFLTNVGANGIATLVLAPYGQSGPITYASDEHGSYAPPMIEVTQAGALTKPSFLTAVPGAPSGIDLEWLDNSAIETGIRIERRALGGAFAMLQDLAADTIAFSDASALPGVIYEYRVRATGAPEDSSWSVPAMATAPGSATGYQLWLQTYGLPMDGSGLGAPSAEALHDGIDNLVKYALGLGAYDFGGGRLSFSLADLSGSRYLTLTFIHPDPPPTGLVYSVKASDALSGWTAAGLVEIGNSVDGGLRTITVRDSTTIPASGGSRYMMLEVTQP